MKAPAASRVNSRLVVKLDYRSVFNRRSVDRVLAAGHGGHAQLADAVLLLFLVVIGHLHAKARDGRGQSDLPVMGPGSGA